jgi:hypothetical protein
MAFGDLKGTLSGTGASTLATNVCAGSVSIAIGDLIVLITGQQNAATLTGINDNLGNTYAGTTANIDAGNITTVMRYAFVTVAGTLTAVNVTANTSANDWAGIALVFEGPFKTSGGVTEVTPVANGDLTSPLVCPASGALPTDLEMVIAWGGSSAGDWSAVSPFTEQGEVNQAATVHFVLSSNVVTDQSSQTPSFTTGVNPSAAVLGVASFSGVKQGGVLVAQASTVEGDGVSSSSGTGALVSGASEVDGSGFITATGTGTLAATTADVEGAGASSSAGSGVLASGESAVDGEGGIPDGTGGDLEAAPCQIEGVGVVSNIIASVSARVGSGGVAASVSSGNVNVSVSG